MFSPSHAGHVIRLAAASAVLSLVAGGSTAWAHARPQTTAPEPYTRIDAPPAHIAVTFDNPVEGFGSALALLDATGGAVPTAPDQVDSNRQVSVSPSADLAPGPYTVGWTSLDATDGDTARGFYTFVINGGQTGILSGWSQSQAPAADLRAWLTVTSAEDGSSLLRVDLDQTAGVQRIRIRLSRPDLGEDLLDTQPTADGGWVLNGNDVAVPGDWHAVVIVRRADIFDDAQAEFDFTIDATTGAPSFL